MSSNKGRNITVTVSKDNIIKSTPGSGAHFMIEKALTQGGYKDVYVADTALHISTKAGHRWHGNLPSAIVKKLRQSSAAKARPKTMKAFSFVIRVFRTNDFNYAAS